MALEYAFSALRSTEYEEELYKKAAKALLALTDAQLEQLLENKALMLRSRSQERLRNMTALIEVADDSKTTLPI